MIVVYVAGKFRGPSAWDVELNVRAAEEVGYQLARWGFAPLIPHTNTRFFNGTFTEQFWLDATMALLEKCDALVTVSNWKESVGANGEVDRMIEIGRPVFHSVLDCAEYYQRVPHTVREMLDRDMERGAR